MLYARFLLNFCAAEKCLQLQKTKTKKASRQRKTQRKREQWKDEAKENDQN
jgi:hypothetical protein